MPPRASGRAGAHGPRGAAGTSGPRAGAVWLLGAERVTWGRGAVRLEGEGTGCSPRAHPQGQALGPQVSLAFFKEQCGGTPMVVSLSSAHWSWEAGPGGTLLLLLSWWGLCTGSPSQKMGDHGVRAPMS